MRWNVERLSTRNAHTATHLFRRNTRASCDSHPSLSAQRMNFFFNMRGTVVRQIAEDRAVPGMFWQRKNNVCSLVRDWIFFEVAKTLHVLCVLHHWWWILMKFWEKRIKTVIAISKAMYFLGCLWQPFKADSGTYVLSFHIGWHVTVISWISSVTSTKVVLYSFYHQMTDCWRHTTLAFNTIKLLIKQKQS